MELPRTPSFRLEGKRALVAGASSGLGLGAAAALAGAGAELVMAARRAPELTAAVAAVRAGGGRVGAGGPRRWCWTSPMSWRRKRRSPRAGPSTCW